MRVSVLDKPMAKTETHGSEETSVVDRKLAAKYQKMVDNGVENAILRAMDDFKAQILKSIVLNH